MLAACATDVTTTTAPSTRTAKTSTIKTCQASVVFQVSVLPNVTINVHDF